VIFLKLENYEKIVKKHSKKEDKFKDILIAFFFGGLLGILSELFVQFLEGVFYMPKGDAYMYLSILLVTISSVATGLGFFDKWISFAKCGLNVPTTGFAHSVQSSALDYKKEGLVTGLGSNFFKLAGSVILYGILSAFLFVIVKVIIGG